MNIWVLHYLTFPESIVNNKICKWIKYTVWSQLAHISSQLFAFCGSYLCFLFIIFGFHISKRTNYIFFWKSWKLSKIIYNSTNLFILYTLFFLGQKVCACDYELCWSLVDTNHETFLVINFSLIKTRHGFSFILWTFWVCIIIITFGCRYTAPNHTKQ